MLNVTKLRNDINEKLDKWDEKSQFTLAGVRNLSYRDLDTLLNCCELYDIDYDLDKLILNNEIRAVLNRYSE